MNTSKFVLPEWVKTVWKWLRWPLGIAAIIYIALFIWGLYLHGEKYATEDAVAYINSQKLTLADVRGDNLPPAPDAADTTLEGQDQNLNGIRDDVELKVFELYPDDIKVRAAELQYAKSLQLELTEWVFNKETYEAVLLTKTRGYFCVTGTGPDASAPNLTNEEFNNLLAVGDERIKEVEDLVFNTQRRKEREERNYDLYMTSYGGWRQPACDLEI
jgi:hypothetical protein